MLTEYQKRLLQVQSAIDQFEAGANTVCATPQATTAMRSMVENMQKRSKLLRTLIDDELKRVSEPNNPPSAH